uniref:G_PROTEIN_RECEP_F1_2 domain-containing protein n=1 Tax=Caenorhabditis japonica TaxID=281687 RepID=A0A8R1I2K0_CAEJA
MTANTKNYDYYDYDARLEDEIERAEDASILFAKISIAFAIFALFANCAHLFFLINKELRKLSVFVIMLSLCISDIFSLCVALVSFIYKLLPLSRDGYCEPFVSLLETQITRALSAIGTAALSTSLWLTILMAAFRSLSSLFVMSKLKGILAKVSTAITVIVVIVMYSILSSAFQFYGIYRIQIRNDSESCVPTGSVNFTYRKQFKCAVLPDQFEWSRKFDYVSTAATYIQTLLYTIFTVILVVSVKKTKKESKIVNRLETTRKDNTTKMVLAMLIAFLITKVWEYMSTAIFLSLPESYIKMYRFLLCF